ncbi:MAG: iron-containing alcohol dehydrogenase [Anaerolineaceae bacterium]|nr:MAG: iron-containing alcohol dehydrogenase [Anaerolineaceae bacterium]
MLNFEYYTPTKVYFGRDSDDKIGKALKEYGYTKILLHYGSASAEKSGLLTKIRNKLKDEGLDYVELGGVEANPRIDLIRQGIEYAKKESVDFILAIGGGSVIDSAKSIGLGIANEMDPWDMIMGQIKPTKSFPIGAVLTLAAAGSEMSNSHVVTNSENYLKRSLNDDLLRPVVAFLNPEHTYTVSKYQTGCGIVDTFMHTFERYFTVEEDNDLTDRIAEGLMVAVKNAGLVAINEPDNYEARATLMWASSLSHNGLTGCGKGMLFPVHKLEHDFSGLFDVAHAAGLSVLFPAWARYIYHHDIRKFSQFANRVWAVEMDHEHPEKTALKGIEAMTQYFRNIGMPTTMQELGINPSDYEKIVDMTTDNGTKEIMSYIPLKKEDILKIYQLAEE